MLFSFISFGNKFRSLYCLFYILFNFFLPRVHSSPNFVTYEEAVELRDEVKNMFYHGYDNYMNHAFPLDEIKPISCRGEDTLGGYSLTLVDSLDMLALLGNRTEFSKAVIWCGSHLNFDKNKTVSLFETNIRIMGGLLSAHIIASDVKTGMSVEGYKDELLHLATDLGNRLLPAFQTPTGIPFGSVNLRHGVLPQESKITSTAGGGTLVLEFGMLSRLTNNPIYEEVAKNAVRGLWSQRSPLNLVGAHINIFSGEWTHRESGVGTSIDSFYEYLAKAYVLFGEEEFLHIFNEAYKAVIKYVFHDPWYLEVNMYNAVVVWPLFNSLQAFWPGLQVLVGDIERATRTHNAFFSVWKKYGFTPEGFNLASSTVQPGQKSYPLRPELAESTYWLYKATYDPHYLVVGRDILTSLSTFAKCRCGFCHISDVENLKKTDHMESFFLSETVKYLWLLFDLAAGGKNLIENGPYSYVFSTEGHYFPLTSQISLSSEECKYEGSFCSQKRISKIGKWENHYFNSPSEAEGGVEGMGKEKEKEKEREKGKEANPENVDSKEKELQNDGVKENVGEYANEFEKKVFFEKENKQIRENEDGNDMGEGEEGMEEELKEADGVEYESSIFIGLCPRLSVWRELGMTMITEEKTVLFSTYRNKEQINMNLLSDSSLFIFSPKEQINVH